MTSGSPRSDEQYRIDSVKGRRLDEHGDDGTVQPGGPGRSCDDTNAPAVHDEARDDHKCENGVEPDRNRKVRKTKVDGGGVPVIAARSGDLVEEGGTHCCSDDVGAKYGWLVEESNTYPQS